MARRSLKQRVRDIWRKLRHLNATPHQIGAGFALGVFVSFLPIIPFRTLVALALAGLLRMNVIAAFAGKSITLLFSPLTPLLWLAEYRLGARFVVVERAEAFDRTHLGELLRMGWDIFAAMLVGAVILATPAALLSYGVIKIMVARRQPGNSAPLSGRI